MQRYGAKGGWIIWDIWMAACFGPQLVGRSAYFIGDMSQIMVVFWVALTVVGVIWSFWSLLHAAVRS